LTSGGFHQPNFTKTLVTVITQEPAWQKPGRQRDRSPAAPTLAKVAYSRIELVLEIPHHPATKWTHPSAHPKHLPLATPCPTMSHPQAHPPTPCGCSNAADEVLAGGKLRLRFGVREGSAEEAEDIGLDVARALHRHGLKVIWDGKAQTQILVDMVWQKRRAGGPLSGADRG
jgi:hypothetical protein